MDYTKKKHDARAHDMITLKRSLDDAEKRLARVSRREEECIRSVASLRKENDALLSHVDDMKHTHDAQEHQLDALKRSLDAAERRRPVVIPAKEAGVQGQWALLQGALPPYIPEHSVRWHPHTHHSSKRKKRRRNDDHQGADTDIVAGKAPASSSTVGDTGSGGLLDPLIHSPLCKNETHET
jgi:hypothetical protein